VDRAGGGWAGLAAGGADIVVADLEEREVTGRAPVNTG